MAEALLIAVGSIAIAIGLGSLKYGEQWIVSLRRRSGVDAWIDTTRIARTDRVMAIVNGLVFFFVGLSFVMVGIAVAASK